MIHNLLEMIKPEDSNAYLIMPMILKQFSKDSAILDDQWNEKAFLSMEAIRKIAMNNGHYIEETLILLYENRYFREKHKDDGKYLNTVKRMNELQMILDKEDDYFLTIYGKLYPISNILARKSIDWWIRYMYNKVRLYADFFSGNLDYKTAQLCGKLMLKIAVISPENVTFDQTMEALFARAIDYGNIRDFHSAFKFYNLAIDRAISKGDKTYLFIAIQRKLSICTGLAQLDSQTDFDIERKDCVHILNGMMTENVTSVEDLGKSLVCNEEMKKIKSSLKKKKYYQNRINKIKEATPMLSAQLAMARGDEETSRIYLEQLKQEEHRAYGCDPGFSSADMFDIVYSMLFNSPEREECEEGMDVGQNSSVEDDVLNLPQFMEEMIPSQKFNCTLFLIRNFIIRKMFKSAEAYCGHLAVLADEAKSDYHTAMALNAYGQVQEAQQNNTKALRIYKEAFHLLECADPTISDADLSPYLYYNLLCEIANLTKDEDAESAVYYYSNALEWLEKHHMPQMLFMFHILNGRADAYQKIGKQDLADKDRADFLKFAEDETRRRIMLLDADSRDIFWNDTRSLIYGTIAHVCPDSSEYFKSEAYNAVLLSKGMLLASDKSVKDIVLEKPEMKLLYDELEEDEKNRKQWGTSDTVEEYTAVYLKSMKLVEKLEKFLPDNDSFLHTETNEIIKALGDGDVLVDYFDYEMEDADRQYIAFVLKHGASSPKIVELCKESDLCSFFETQMKILPDGKEVDFSVVYEAVLEESHRLEGMIWKPVENYFNISPENRILFVPSGSLHKVAIESLPFGDSWSQTLCDRYRHFARISHARVLLSSDIVSDKQKAVIFASPDYGGNTQDTSITKGYSVQMNEHEYENVTTWPSLPDTLAEAEELQALFNLAKWKVDTFSGKDASTANFERLSGQSPTILHISTHGFAETKKSAKNIPALSSFYKPLDLTGIVLADGNEGWAEGTRFDHKGLVLASEIARMDLSNSDIVFVSCCFSGEGIVKPDGIYGIQRALKIAGAKSIIMSLWAEHGYAGRIFAGAFYRAFLNGKGKFEAFRIARQMVREQTGNPYLWAGFIMLD